VKKMASRDSTQPIDDSQQGITPSQGTTTWEKMPNSATTDHTQQGMEDTSISRRKRPILPTCQRRMPFLFSNLEMKAFSNKSPRKHNANTCK
jgi:hypothetical protein